MPLDSDPLSPGVKRFVLGANRRLDPEESVKKAQEALRADQVWLAEQIANELIGSEPNKSAGLCILAEVASRTGKRDLAISLYEKAIRNGAVPAGEKVKLSALLQAKGQLVEAEAILNDLVKENSNNPAIYLQLGTIRLDQNRQTEALELLDKGLEIDPANAGLHHYRGVALNALNRPQEAVAALQRAIGIAPNNAMSYVSLGNLLVSSGRAKEGAAMMRKAHDLAPRTPFGHMQMARALTIEDNSNEAETWARKAIELDPGNREAFEVLSGVLLPLGRFDELETMLRQELAKHPNNIAAYVTYATSHKFTETDRPIVEAMRHIAANAQLAIVKENIGYSLGKALADLGDYQGAMTAYDEANRCAKMRLEGFAGPYNKAAVEAYMARLMSTYTRDYFKNRQGFSSPRETPLFVVGMIRSGTTLTEQILTSHPQIAGAGELRYWVEIAQRARFKQEDPAASPQAEQIANNFLKILYDVSADAARVTDKMPLNFMGLGPIHALFPNARIVHVKRSPVDNCLSVYQTQYRNAPEFGHDKENIVHFYRLYQKLSDHWKQTLPEDRYTEVQYEDLVGSQEATTKRMIEFVGLPWNESCLRPEDNDRSVNTPSLWQARQPVYKTSTEKWRKYEPWLGPLRELVED
jgi:tetratricopeptide (TPR) repeat protein